MESQLEEFTKKEEKVVPKNIKVEKKRNRKDKYVKAIEQIIYFMLNNDWVITLVEQAKLNLTISNYRILCLEIEYYYRTYGNINIADFYTYIQDKEEIKNTLDEILETTYSEETNEEELNDYFKVIRDYSIEKEIERLTKLMKQEHDPDEQAKIGNQIMKLRLGE